MSQLEERDDFYAAGRKLTKHIADSKGKEVSTATLQALIRDFLPQHEELQEALRSIVARQDFLRLVKLASSGQGFAQKCALVESLKNIYSAKTVEAADRLVCGMLGASVKTAHDDSEGQKTTVNTFSHERKASNPQVARQNANPSERSHAHGKGREVGENLSSAPPAHSLRNLGLFLVAAFVAGGIWETMKTSPPARDLFAPYHVRSGSPRQMPNNTGIPNELLAEAILANAKLQCDSETGQNGGYEASLNRYRSFIRAKSIGNRVTNSYTFQQLSASLKEAMKNSGSCEAPGSNAALEKAKDWLL